MAVEAQPAAVGGACMQDAARERGVRGTKLLLGASIDVGKTPTATLCLLRSDGMHTRCTASAVPHCGVLQKRMC